MSGVQQEWVGGSFVQIHHGLLRALGGDYETAAVIWAVHYHAGAAGGWWKASWEEFEEATCLTRSKLKRALRRAREDGFIERADAGTFDRTSRWRVCYAVDAQVVPDGDNRPIDGAEVARSDRANIAHSLSCKKEEELSSGRSPDTPGEPVEVDLLGSVTPIRKPSLKEQIEAEFETWWKLYPRKDGKQHAKKAYAAARKRVTADFLLAAIEKARDDLLARELKFRPMGSTWLNGQRWEDDLDDDGDDPFRPRVTL